MVESKFLPLTRIFASQLNALMVGKMQSLFPSTRSLIIKDSKCPHGQAVKTSPSHGGIWGSIPHGGTTKTSPTRTCFYFTPMGNGTLCVRNYVARTPEIWAGAQHMQASLLFHYYAHFVHYDSHLGVPKKTLIMSVFFILHFSSFIYPMGNSTLCVRNYGA